MALSSIGITIDYGGKAQFLVDLIFNLFGIGLTNGDYWVVFELFLIMFLKLCSFWHLFRTYCFRTSL